MLILKAEELVGDSWSLTIIICELDQSWNCATIHAWLVLCWVYSVSIQWFGIIHMDSFHAWEKKKE